MPTDRRKCEDCHFWAETTPMDGECRLRPPVPWDNALHGWGFPVTSSGDWCGEFEPREDQP